MARGDAMQQLTLAIDARTDPRTCPHREPYPLDGIYRCAAHGGCSGVVRITRGS